MTEETLRHRILIECPCCNGKGFLVVRDEQYKFTMRSNCTHCMGAGMVAMDNFSVRTR